MARLTREQSQAQTRNRLLDAAAVEFGARGFAAASVDDIAERAGYSKVAVYSNFHDKDDLFLALLARVASSPRTTRRIRWPVARSRPPRRSSTSSRGTGAPGRADAARGWRRAVIRAVPRGEPLLIRGDAVSPSEAEPRMTDPKIETVQRVYAAFGRGDIDAILAEVAETVDWAPEAASTSAPWYGSYRTKSELPRFFKEIGTSLEVSEFTPLSFTSNDTDVMATVRFAVTVTATGKKVAMNLHHWWRFADGKIVFYRGSEDTEQTAAAFA